jgi:4'-phosphopantetheinyl transferase EntD
LQSNKRNDQTSLRLWFARVEDLTVEAKKQIESLLFPSERRRLQLTTSIKKQKEFLQSRALMRRALTQTFGLEEAQWCFTEYPNRPPDISNLPGGVFYSLSHSDGLICFAIADCTVGVDLECNRPRENLHELADAFMSAEEFSLLESQNAQTTFYKIWSAKEAYYKALPALEQAGFNFKNYSLPVQQSSTDGDRFFYSCSIDQYVLSVVTVRSLQSIRSYPQSMDVVLTEGLSIG